MDPLTIATTFSTIVGLMANFASEKRGEETSTFEEFLKWLSEHHHEKVVGMLEKNAVTTTSIKALLSYNHKDIVTRLTGIDELVAKIASGYPELRPMVESINPTALLSPQALSVIEQFNDSGATKVLEGRFIGSALLLHCMEGAGGNINYTEPRFIEDDLATLVELGLLRLEHNSKGNKIYIFTREAERFVKSYRM